MQRKIFLAILLFGIVWNSSAPDVSSQLLSSRSCLAPPTISLTHRVIFAKRYGVPISQALDEHRIYHYLSSIRSKEPFVHLQTLPTNNTLKLKELENVDDKNVILHLLSLIYDRARKEGFNTKPIKFWLLFHGFGYLFENVMQHEFSNEVNFDPLVRIFAYHEGIRVEIMGRCLPCLATLILKLLY